MHKISKTMALMGLLAPMGVGALGIGDIRLHSALDQSLIAEIPLVLSGNDTLGDVKVSLASPEAFAKAGLERQYFLSKLQFTPVQTANGNYVIKVSSRDAITEPFLDFLVEVNWPQGRLLREFTVLLDPPSSLPEESTTEIAAPEIQRPYRSYERVAEIRRASEAPPRPRRSAATPAAPRAAPLPPPSEAQLTDTAYGPVRRDESLWGIAKTINQDQAVTQDQMVVALFRANPQAFSGNRINALKAGSILRLPNRDFIAQLSPSQARAEFARQQGWKTQVRGTEPPVLETEPPQAQLKLLSPATAKSKGQGAVSGNEAGGSGKAKGELALEVAETVKQENEEFRSRLLQLEQKLGEMQRILSLKDEQIATLQSQQRAAPVQPPAKPAAEAEQAAVQPTGIEKPPTPTPSPQPKPTPSEAATPPPAAVQPAPKPATPAKPAPNKPVAPPPAAKESEFPFDATYLYVGGAFALVGFGAWLVIRRRNAIIAATESILLAAERDSQQRAPISSAKLMEDSPEPVIATKSSFLSEFTPSDFDALGTETDEVDPVSEADVYLAYGRYKQAEELIRHAIQQHPDRDECKLKLLEIYYATENRPAFESYARELKAQRKDTQREFWEKVEEMGRELLPDSALFQLAGSPRQTAAPKKTAATPASSLGSLDLSDDLIDDLKRFEIEFLDTSLPASETGGTGRISLDSDDEPMEIAFEEKSPAPRQGENDINNREKPLFDTLDFDLDFLKADTAKEEEPEDRRVEETGKLENLIPFDTAMKSSQAREEIPDEGSDKTIDDILRELTSQIGQAPEQAKAGTAATKPASAEADRESLGSLDFDFGMLEPADELVEADESAPEISESGEKEDLFAGLTDMDQFETKLDLAKAYADMDDEDSAREILQEVAAKGNDKQKAEAAMLLDKMERHDANPGLSLAAHPGQRL